VRDSSGGVDVTDLQGRTLLVTGSAGGLGTAMAHRLSRAGARLVLTDHDEQALARLAAAVPGATTCVLDVSSESGTDEAMAHARDTYGEVDGFVLNAGVPGPLTPLPDMSVEDFDRVCAVNLRGTFLGLRAAFREFDRIGRGGSVVITASIASLRGSDDLIAYQATKHGVLGLLRGAAMYGGPRGVRVNAVAPGIVPTALFAASGGGPGGQDDMALRAATTPLRRAGRAEEVAGVVAFLLGDDASYMTGEVVSVDGGASIVSVVRPSGGAGAWDTGAVDGRWTATDSNRNEAGHEH
jgi:NAD(P)-dependent dehydrogenase (short-subunit alcohol dehydrogenase family)